MNILISFICGFIAFPILVYIGYPIFKKWLIKKVEEWKTSPKIEENKNEA